MYFQPHHIEKLRDGYLRIDSDYERLLSSYLTLQLTNPDAYEYVRHGFVRRIGTLKRCIENVYSIYSPERSDKPSRNECVDLAINLQSFIFNVFGCIDNLAWIWVKEKDVKDTRGRSLRDQQVGLRAGCTVVRETFSYVAPYTLNPAKLDEHSELETRKQEAHRQHDFDLWLQLDTEQEKLGTFTPWMMHSFSEGATPVVFHFQLLADWNTVVEMADQFRAELETRYSL